MKVRNDRGPIRILHLEDDRKDAELVRAQLAVSFDCEIVLVDDEKTFRGVIGSQPFDLIISDNTLQGMDGLCALRIARELSPQTPLIFVSGTIGEETAIEAMRGGAADYVLKHRLAKLPLTVERVLAESRRDAERVQMEAALRNSERLFRQLAESVREVFWVMSSDLSRVLYVSPAYEEIWGQSVESHYQAPRSKYEAVHPEDREMVMTGLRGAGKPGGVSLKYRILQPSGTLRWILERAYPSKDAAGEFSCIAGVARDITEQTRLEEQLLQSQKVEAIGRLAGGVAHDFNNVLAVILGYSELILNDLPAADPNRALIQTIMRAGGRAAGLTRQLLAFSRRQVLQLRVLDLNVIVAEVSQMLRRVIGEDIALLTVPAEALGRVKADPGQIEQILMNLMVNARDAMPGGGKVIVTTENVEASDLTSGQSRGAISGRHVVLQVQDTGCGMTPEVQARIFEPFFTTKASHHGTGLGLATVLSIVEQCGGFVTVNSQVGQGTTFRIHLPRVDLEVEDAAPVAGRHSPTGRTETILLVEDEEGVRSFAKTVLLRSGYTVLEAETPERALRIAREHAGTIHLLLADVVLPCQSGPALAEEMRQIRPGIRVVFMSGYFPDWLSQHGHGPGSTPVVEKPFTAKELVERLAESLDRGYALPPD